MQAVRSYGTQDTLGEETAVKGAILFNALKPYRRRLLRNPDVPMVIKRQVVSTLMLSKGLFHCGTWPIANWSEISRIKNPVMQAYRAVAGLDDQDNGSYASDAAMCDKVEALHPVCLLKYHRIACAARVARKAVAKPSSYCMLAKGPRDRSCRR